MQRLFIIAATITVLLSGCRILLKDRLEVLEKERPEYWKKHPYTHSNLDWNYNLISKHSYLQYNYHKIHTRRINHNQIGRHGIQCLVSPQAFSDYQGDTLLNCYIYGMKFHGDVPFVKYGFAPYYGESRSFKTGNSTVLDSEEMRDRMFYSQAPLHYFFELADSVGLIKNRMFQENLEKTLQIKQDSIEIKQ